MKNRITLISLNFYPEDTAIGLYSTQMAEYLSENGFNVEVVTGFPYYPQWNIYDEYRKKGSFKKDRYKDLNIYRYKQYVPREPSFIKRTVHMLDFTIGSFFNLFKIHNTDLVICVVPFTTSILLGKILSTFKKAPLWIHIQDFEFDAALQTGVSNNKSIIFKLLFSIEKKLLRSAKVTSSISNSMLQKLEEKTNKRPYFLPNWIDESNINPDFANQHPFFQDDKFNILYSGNIGAKQDWAFFMEFAENLQLHKDINIVLVGSGAKRAEIEDGIAQFHNVRLHQPVPYEDLRDLLCGADLHILFQKEDVIDTVMPSKLLGMMASQKPSLITGNLESEVAIALNDSEGGFYHKSGNMEAVLDSVLKVKENPDKAKEMGKKARAFVVAKYSKNKVLRKLSNRIKELLDE